MESLEGIPVSEGVAAGRVFVLDDLSARIVRRPIAPDQTEEEIARFEKAREAAVEDLRHVHERAKAEIGEDAARIFLVHLGMLQDSALIEPVRDKIRTEHIAAESAVSEVFRMWGDRFRSMNEVSFTTKADDVRDLADRVLERLVGARRSRLAEIGMNAIVIARDLTPSQAVNLDKNKVLAFVTDLGGRTSHTAIVAKALGLPAVVGCRRASELAIDGESVIVDGHRGRVILSPDEETAEQYKEYAEQRRRFRVSLGELASLEAVTPDGHRIELMGNIEFPEEAASVVEVGGGGVGLYRTEFLYLTSDHEPSEEEHYEAYAKCIELLDGLPLTIRTVDLGADKYTQQRVEQPERNPFLGCRSIRYCLRSLPMFKTQLRAILRASSLGPVKLMFPLISGVEEFRQARLYVRDVMEDLRESGVDFDPDIPIGMMVETPSAAVIADMFAREADFFSIGSNDLIQYTIAVDRTNEQVAHLYDPHHPAVIRLIRQIVDAGRRNDIPVSICGESASIPEYALLLMGLGLRTLSATASALPNLKRVVRGVPMHRCEQIARKAFTLDSAAQISAYLRDQARQLVPEAFDGRSVEA